jgi:alpha-beta hydrolase superfamily lysophospholipase
MRELAYLAWSLLLYALAGYLVLALVLFTFQRNLLYLPIDFKPSDQQLAEVNLRYWPSYENYRGYTSVNELTDAKGTIIVFHGNAATAYHREFYVNALSQQGFRVILAEYPGYGGREGKPSEDTFVKDALATLRLVHQAYGEPLYLWGESLGGGVVSGVASQTGIPLKGLVLFLPWDSLSSLAQALYWYLPAHWMVLDHYNNIDNLAEFEGNIAVLLAEKDEVIPVQHSMELYKSLKTTRKLWVFKGAGHNSVSVDPELGWWKEVCDFMSN